MCGVGVCAALCALVCVPTMYVHHPCISTHIYVYTHAPSPPPPPPPHIRLLGSTKGRAGTTTEARTMIPSLDATAGGPSAQAARLMLHAVQRYVCLAQLHMLLQHGSLPAAPPGVTPVPDSKPAELREGSSVELFTRLTCTVAFARGQERNVLFDIKGLPQQQGRGGVQDPDELEGLSGPPPTAAEIAAATPVVVVADANRPMVQGPGVPYCGPGAWGAEDVLMMLCIVCR